MLNPSIQAVLLHKGAGSLQGSLPDGELGLEADTAVEAPSVSALISRSLQASTAVNSQEDTSTTISPATPCVYIPAVTDAQQAFEASVTPLTEAAQKGELETIERLLGDGAPVNAADSYGSCALHYAAEGGHSAVVQRLICARAATGALDQNGRTALHLAAANGHVSVLEHLLKAGSDVTAQDKSGDTALHKASGAAAVTAIERLLEAGGAVDARNRNGMTALHVAALGDADDAISRLLEAGAAADAQSKDGMTALHYATAKGAINAVVRLLEANPLAVNAIMKRIQCLSALHLAAGLGNITVVEKLVEAGADVNQLDECGRSALLCAAEKGHAAVVESLVTAHCADYDLQDKYGWTALHWAAHEGHASVVRFLLDKDLKLAQFPLKTKAGTTALHLAAWAGHLDVVQLLNFEHLEWPRKGAGSYLSQQDDSTRDALHFAVQQKHWDVAEYLLENGAGPECIDKQLLLSLCKRFALSPLVVVSQDFQKTSESMSVVAVLFATVAWVGWINPPGGFSDGLTLLDVELCPDYPISACSRYRNGVLLGFFVSNSVTFTLSVAAVMAALLIGIPSHAGTFVQQARLNTRKIALLSGLLFLALIFGLIAFTLASFAVMPHEQIAWTIGSATFCWAIILFVIFSLRDALSVPGQSRSEPIVAWSHKIGPLPCDACSMIQQ